VSLEVAPGGAWHRHWMPSDSTMPRRVRIRMTRKRLQSGNGRWHGKRSVLWAVIRTRTDHLPFETVHPARTPGFGWGSFASRRIARRSRSVVPPQTPTASTSASA
jgi:hypothetical protein